MTGIDHTERYGRLVAEGFDVLAAWIEGGPGKEFWQPIHSDFDLERLRACGVDVRRVMREKRRSGMGELIVAVVGRWHLCFEESVAPVALGAPRALRGLPRFPSAPRTRKATTCTAEGVCRG
mgnify:FL=1